jgi:preprotein translocase subunit SecA
MLFSKLFGNPNERKIKAIQPIIDHIQDLEAEMQALSDDQLRAKTAYFRQELDQRERFEEPDKDYQAEQALLDLLLPEAFAVVREASRRVLGMRHFDVQLVGGYYLHKGHIAEMRTGEGKTLVATAPTYLNALTGKGVHVVTVNDYLARRDSEWMGQIFQFLGMTVGLVAGDDRGFNQFEQKRAAYAADVTYGTNNEFGFDYLRDNMATHISQMVQRPYYFAVVDEVDSILIDEARTPLIISGRLEQSAELYQIMARLAPLLQKEQDYTLDEKGKSVVLTEEGIDKAQELLQIEDLFDPEHHLAHHVLQALRAKDLFQRDVDYVVKDDQVMIVDEFTGRMMEGRRWSDGLHQALEAKEAVTIQDESQTLASITYQNLFRLYPKLSGMTGTAMTEEAEFGKIYNLEVTAIPTNRGDQRENQSDLIFKSQAVKYVKIVEDIIEHHSHGRPVLVGTISIEKSEYISALLTDPRLMRQHLLDKVQRLVKKLEGSKYSALVGQYQAIWQAPDAAPPTVFEQIAKDVEGHEELYDFVNGLSKTVVAIAAIRKGVPHKVLNAKFHEQEALIVSQAGRFGAITIATNMAGRGTDILLGGNPDIWTKEHFAQHGQDWHHVPKEDFQAVYAGEKAITDSEKDRVVALGGLHIIGSERHESRRIDNQLRGRAARQGDPGSTRFYLSLEDNLMRLFGGQRIAGLMDMLNVEETLPITAGIVSKAIESAQRKVEAYHFDVRKGVLQYDDVLTEQRKLIYGQRRQVLQGSNLQGSFEHMITTVLDRTCRQYLIEAKHTTDDMDPEVKAELLQTLHTLIPQLAFVNDTAIAGLYQADLIQYVQKQALTVYKAMEQHWNNIAEELQQRQGVTLMLQSDAEGAPENPMRSMEREILLTVVDQRWIEYLHHLDALRDAIGLRAYGQKDPLLEYRSESFDMFQQLTYDIQQQAVALLFRAELQVEIDAPEGTMPMDGMHAPDNGMTPQQQGGSLLLDASGNPMRPHQPVSGDYSV